MAIYQTQLARSYKGSPKFSLLQRPPRNKGSNKVIVINGLKVPFLIMKKFMAFASNTPPAKHTPKVSKRLQG